jgi:tyrosine-protein kinase Etk/Wzc
MATETPLSELTEHEDLSTSAMRVTPALKGDDELSLLDVLLILSERKRIILRIAAAFALIAIVISLLMPNQYTATVLLLPPQQNSSLSSALTSQLSALNGVAALAGGGGLNLKSPNDMYISMLKSRTVEDGMVQQFGLMQEYKVKYPSEARKAFERHTSVDGNGKDNLIHISFEDKDPKRAAEIANGYIEQYRKLSQHLAITEAAQRRLFFEQQLEEAKNNLADAEDALKKTQQSTGVIEINSQSRALIETAAVLRAQIAAKEVQIQAMQTFATGQNAQLIQVQQELDSMKAQLARLGGSAEDTTGGGFIVPKGKVPQAALEYLRKLRDVKYYETIFEILARQFEVAKLDEAKEGSIVQVIDSAVPPDRKSSPKRGFIVIVSTFVGLFIGVTTALFQAAWAGLKRHREANIKVSRIRQLLTTRGM